MKDKNENSYEKANATSKPNKSNKGNQNKESSLGLKKGSMKVQQA